MKKHFVFFLFLMLGCLLTSAFAESHGYTIVKNPYRFSTYFEFIGKEHYEGRAVKDCLHIRTTYDLYGSDGNYNGQGICRALSLGVIYAWAKEIDLYGICGEKIGFIDGKAATLANARFDFYDQKGSYAGVAYLDYSRKGFTIADPNGGLIAYLKRNVSNEKPSDEDWEMVLYKPGSIDERLLKIFSAFVVDYQDSF